LDARLGSVLRFHKVALSQTVQLGIGDAAIRQKQSSDRPKSGLSSPIFFDTDSQPARSLPILISAHFRMAASPAYSSA
jgi:hypothetical protein